MSNASLWVKPIIILVPGAWNGPGSFNLLTPYLDDAGYQPVSVSLPSVGADPPVDSIQPDVEAIRTVIAFEVDAGNDVLLLMHDYASVPGGEAAKGLDKVTRARDGLKGGIVCLFYVATTLLTTGSCWGDALHDVDQSWLLISRNQKVAIAERPQEVFCPEVEPQMAGEFSSSLRSHSYQTFFGRTTWEPYKQIAFFSLFCKLDKMIPLGKQKSSAAATGIKFRSSTIIAGHCPFLAAPEDMAKAIRKAAKESSHYSDVIVRDYGFRARSQS